MKQIREKIADKQRSKITMNKVNVKALESPQRNRNLRPLHLEYLIKFNVHVIYMILNIKISVTFMFK